MIPYCRDVISDEIQNQPFNVIAPRPYAFLKKIGYFHCTGGFIVTIQNRFILYIG
jgi:hypothetical protein